MVRFRRMRHPGRGPRLAEFVGDETGATAIEYALIAVFIAIAIVVSAPAIGVTVAGLFTTVSGKL